MSAAQDNSSTTAGSSVDKGKGKVTEPQDVTMGENEDSSSEEEAEDVPPAEEVEEEGSDAEIDPSNIIPSGRRTRGKQIDFVKAAQELPEEDDEDEDDDFEAEDDDEMEGN